MELRAFFNSRTRPRVNRVLRNQLAGDVLNLVAYRLRCKHYFCHLTRPPSYRPSSFRISTFGRYLRNAGKVGWVANVFWMTQLLLRVRKPLSLTLRWLCRPWCSEQYGDSFIKVWAVEETVKSISLSHTYSHLGASVTFTMPFTSSVAEYADICVRFLWW